MDLRTHQVDGVVVLQNISKSLNEERYADAKSQVDKNFVRLAKDPEFLQVAAETYKANFDYSSESQCYRRLLEIETGVHYLIQYSEALTNINDYPEALKALHRALDLIDDADPVLFEIHKNMGNIYLKCGDLEAAEEKYNLAFAINNQDENLIINYGVLAIQKNDYETAKQRFAAVLQKNDNSDLAWVGLALVHRAFSDHELARACLLRGLDVNAYNKLAIVNYYSWCLQDNIDTNTGIIQVFLEKFPEDQEIKKLASGIHQ